jgi:hypothetical protein
MDDDLNPLTPRLLAGTAPTPYVPREPVFWRDPVTVRVGVKRGRPRKDHAGSTAVPGSSSGQNQ